MQGKKISGIKRHIVVDTQGLPHAIYHCKRQRWSTSGWFWKLLEKLQEKKKLRADFT
jgi:hypothetical protein